MSADNNIQQDQQAREAALTTDQSAEEFFFKHAQKTGRTLQEGEHGYALQEAAKARADNATIAERLADSPQDSSATPQADVHPSLRVPDSPLGYQLPSGVERAEAEQVGNWFRAAELPATAGRFIAEAAVAAAHEPMTDAALSAATNALHRNLRQSWGKDYEATRDGLKAAIDRIDQKHGGKLWEWLDSNPEVLTSPTVVKSLATHLSRKKAK